MKPNIYDNLDWLWPFVEINNNKVYIKNSDVQKINNWCTIDETWKIIETVEYLEKINNYEISKIKQKYQDIIFAKYSLTDQLNMWNEATYITSMSIFEKRDYTAEEIVRLNEIKRAKIWIDEQRKLCGDEILLIV